MTNKIEGLVEAGLGSLDAACREIAEAAQLLAEGAETIRCNPRELREIRGIGYDAEGSRILLADYAHTLKQ